MTTCVTVSHISCPPSAVIVDEINVIIDGGQSPTHNSDSNDKISFTKHYQDVLNKVAVITAAIAFTISPQGGDVIKTIKMTFGAAERYLACVIYEIVLRIVILTRHFNAISTLEKFSEYN